MLPIYNLLAASEDGATEATWVSSATAKSRVWERLCVRMRGKGVSFGRFWKWVLKWSFGGSVRGFVGFWRRLGGESCRNETEAISFVGSGVISGFEERVGEEGVYLSHYLVETFWVVCGFRPAIQYNITINNK
jgi:hypothetical protein